MSRVLPLAATLAVAAGCIGHEQEVVPVGEFYVELDPVAGTVRVIPEIGAQTAGLEQIDVVFDGVVGSGPRGTLEAVAGEVGYGMEDCGVPASFCGEVVLRTFLDDVWLYNLYVEVTRQTPMEGNSLLDTDIAPYGLGDYFGVYYYGVLLNAERDRDTATRRWVVEDNDVALRLRARVLGTPVEAP